jgi:hypothetical protein
VKILRFEMNVPMEVAVQSEGVSVEGRYGTRTMFTLTDGRVMYVPPIVASKIHEAGIVPGESFQLCKASVKTGQKRSIEWLLDRASPEPSPVSESITSGTTETPLEHDLRLSIEIAQANKGGVESMPANCAEQMPPFAPLGNGHCSNGNGSGLKLIPNGTAPVTKLEHALKTAISAAYNAEKFGSELGYVVRFDADAIKSMAITVLINMSERSLR